MKALELAYARVRVPDLDEAERFYNLFGLPTRLRTDERLYARGTGPEHHLIVAEKGERKFISLAFYASSEEDLRRAGEMDGASAIEEIDEPGGGLRVRLTDPDGNQIELVHGIARTDALPAPSRHFNYAAERSRRRNLAVRPDKGPAHVLRIGHIVLRTANVRRLAAWYVDIFGLRESDDVVLPDDSDLLMSFLRLDQGETPVDHHVVQFLKGEPATLHHISFEVQDIDDLHMGAAALQDAGYRRMWGVGRHVQGSQIFDYWLDPFGVMYEHWTDTDVFDASAPKVVLALEDLTDNVWGPPMPPAFLEHGTT